MQYVKRICPDPDQWGWLYEIYEVHDNGLRSRRITFYTDGTAESSSPAFDRNMAGHRPMDGRDGTLRELVDFPKFDLIHRIYQMD